MRTRRRPSRPGRHRLLLATIATAWLVTACGGGSPSASPSQAATVTATPRPLPTPWPPLTAPAQADDVYLALLADHIAVAPLDADAGVGGRDPVKRIHATYEGWPLAISQYKTAKTLASATHWAPGARPVRGEAPIAFIGLNILVQWGPLSTTTAPKAPDAPQLAAAGRLRDALARLLSPLTARTIVALPAPAPAASPGASAGSSATP